MLMRELNLVVLDSDENFLGTLNPEYVDIEEHTELQSIKELDLTHPLFDNVEGDLNQYLDLLKHGNKIYQNLDCDGNSYLYVVNGEKEINHLDNEIKVKLLGVECELAELPPKLFKAINYYYDDFEDGVKTGRESPYKDWVAGAGSIDIISDLGGEGELNNYDTNLKQAGTVENVSGSVGTTWSGWEGHSMVESVVTAGDAKAAYTTITNNTSKLLGFTNLSLNIPTGATIKGVVVSYRVQRGITVVSANVTLMQLLLNGAVIGNNQYSSPVSMTRPYTAHDVGSSTNLWGATLDPSVVNNSTFGVAIRVNNSSSTEGLVFIDYFRIRVYYESLTGAANYGDRIEGDYSLYHAGNGNNSHENVAKVACTYNKLMIQYKFKLYETGSSTNNPELILGLFKYQDTNNNLFFRMYFDVALEKNIFQLVKRAGGSNTVLATVEGDNKKLELNKIYNVKIFDDGYTAILYLENREILVCNYTVTTTTHTHVGMGANFNTKILIDDIGLYEITLDKKRIVSIELLEEIFGNYYEVGNISGELTIDYSGVISPMGLIRKVEEQNNSVFVFSYEYNPIENKIYRSVNVIGKDELGKTHKERIEIGYNTENIVIEENEEDLRVAAAPVGFEEKDDLDKISKEYRRMQRWLYLQITKGDVIPLWVTIDDSGFEDYGPCVTAPYNKDFMSLIVFASSDDWVGDYNHCNYKKGVSGSEPRTFYTKSSEEHPINLYWDCVELIRSKINPEVHFEAKVVDINLLKHYEKSYYNVGDKVSLKLPGRSDILQSNIISTKKNPRKIEDDKIEVGNFQFDLFNYRRRNLTPTVE